MNEKRSMAGVGVLLLGLCWMVGAEARGAEAPATQPAKLRHCDAKTPEQLVGWQREMLPTLYEGLGLTEVMTQRAAAGAGKEYGTALNPKVVKQEDKGKYTQYEVSINITDKWAKNVILTVPRKQGRLPAVLLVEGGLDRIYGGKETCGIVLSEADYVTLYVDLAGGATNLHGEPLSVSAQRVLACLRGVDYLCTRPEVDVDRIGCAGLCKFGMIATWEAVVDPRIKSLVSAATLIKDQGGTYYKFMNQEFDLRDWYAMVAPRGLLCQFGKTDGLGGMFPSEKDLADAEAAWQVMGKGEMFQVLWHPGGHMIEGPSSPGFFEKTLGRKG